MIPHVGENIVFAGAPVKIRLLVPVRGTCVHALKEFGVWQSVPCKGMSEMNECIDDKGCK